MTVLSLHRAHVKCNIRSFYFRNLLNCAWHSEIESAVMWTDGTVNGQKVNLRSHGWHEEAKSGFGQQNITRSLKPIHPCADLLYFLQ